MTPEQLLAIAGAVLSIAFLYIPGLREKYALLEDTVKRLIMAGILAGVAAAVYGLACYGFLGFLQAAQVTCDQNGIVELVYAFVLAVIANQSVYGLLPRPESVQLAKLAVRVDSG